MLFRLLLCEGLVALLEFADGGVPDLDQGLEGVDLLLKEREGGEDDGFDDRGLEAVATS